MSVNVLQFATGNGTTNDSQAIMAAVNSLPATGGTVEFPTPPVAYRLAPGGLNPPGLSATGVYINRSNVTLKGNGIGSLLRSDGTGNTIYMAGDNNRVTGLTMDVALAADPPFVTFLAIEGTDCLVDGNTFINSLAVDRMHPRTIGAFSGKTLTNFRFVNNVCHDTMTGFGWGDVQGALVMGNRFVRCREMGLSLVSAADGHVMNDITVMGNIFEGVTNCGVYFGLDGGAHPITCQRLVIKGNVIKGSFSVGGIVGRVTASMEDILIEGNVIDGQEAGVGTNGLYGIALLESGNAGDTFRNCAILNNVISHCSSNGIYLRAVAKRPMRVSGNQVYACQYGLNLEPLSDDADIDFDDNAFEGCSASGMYLKADAGRTIRLRGRGNRVMNNGARGIELVKASTGVLNLRLTDTRIGDDQGSPTQTVGVDWNGCTGTPAFTGLDNDLTQSPTPYSPAASGSWVIR